MFNFSMLTPEARFMLGAGIMGGQNFGQGVSQGAQMAMPIIAQQRQQQEAKQVENKTREWVQKMYPTEDVSQMPPDMLKMYANEAIKKQFAKPTAEFKELQDGTYGVWDGSKFNPLGKAQKPGDVPAAYQDFLMQQKDPAYKAAKEEELRQKNAPTAKDQFEAEQSLWKNWRTDQSVKEYVGVRNGFEKIRASATDPTGAKDLGIIFGYMKMLDPESVVREGEAATVQNAGSVPDQIVGWYNRALSGQKLPDNVRAEIVAAAETLYKETAANYEDVNKQVRNMAERNNIDPQFIAPAEKYEPMKLTIGQKIQTTVGGKPATIERVPD